jgi:hypothetical protein
MPSCHLTGVHCAAIGLFRVVITTKTLCCLFALTSVKIDSLRAPQHLILLHSDRCLVQNAVHPPPWHYFGFILSFPLLELDHQLVASCQNGFQLVNRLPNERSVNMVGVADNPITNLYP